MVRPVTSPGSVPGSLIGQDFAVVRCDWLSVSRGHQTMPSSPGHLHRPGGQRKLAVSSPGCEQRDSRESLIVFLCSTRE